MKGIIPQLSTAAKSDDHDNRKLVKKGDFVINSRSDRRGSCGIAYQDGSVSLINSVLSPKSNMNYDFYNYLFHSAEFASEFYKWGHGIVDDLWTTGWDEMKRIDIPIPPVDVQNKISKILDDKTFKIDALIANEQQQIEKLKAYKQSLISEVVTKGLDPNVPMKDSSVDWIGKIPEGWKIIRIKDAFSLKNEKSYEPINKVNLISLYTELGVVQNKDIVYKTGNKAISTEGYKTVKKGDIIVNIILSWMGAIGVSDYDGVTSPAYDIYEPKNGISSKYFHFLFRTKAFAGECFKQGRGIMMMRWRTYSDEFRSISIPFPDNNNQTEIVEILNSKSELISELVKIKEQKIEKLQQYKQSLIYEYVTGKKEIRQ